MNIFREAKRSIEEGNFPARRTAVVGGILAALLLGLLLIFDFSEISRGNLVVPSYSYSEFFGVCVVVLLIILMVSGAFVLLVRRWENSFTKLLLGASIVLVTSSFVHLLSLLVLSHESFFVNIAESLSVNEWIFALGIYGLLVWVVSWWILPIYKLVTKCKLPSWWLFAIFTTVILPIFSYAIFIFAVFLVFPVLGL